MVCLFLITGIFVKLRLRLQTRCIRILPNNKQELNVIIIYSTLHFMWDLANKTSCVDINVKVDTRIRNQTTNKMTTELHINMNWTFEPEKGITWWNAWRLVVELHIEEWAKSGTATSFGSYLPRSTCDLCYWSPPFDADSRNRWGLLFRLLLPESILNSHRGFLQAVEKMNFSSCCPRTVAREHHESIDSVFRVK